MSYTERICVRGCPTIYELRPFLTPSPKFVPSALLFFPEPYPPPESRQSNLPQFDRRTVEMLSRSIKASTSTSSSSKKRGKRSEEEEISLPAIVLDTLGLGEGQLMFESEDDEAEDEDLEVEEEDGEGEAFPEIEFGESDEDDLEFDGDEDDADDSDDSSLGLVDPDEEAALLAEIEAEDALEEEDDEEDALGKLIREHTTKPDESDAMGAAYEDPELLKDFMRRSRTVISEITGVEKTEWEDEIDAGYGSDSSTEEVSAYVYIL